MEKHRNFAAGLLQARGAQKKFAAMIQRLASIMNKSSGVNRNGQFWWQCWTNLCHAASLLATMNNASQDGGIAQVRLGGVKDLWVERIMNVLGQNYTFGLTIPDKVTDLSSARDEAKSTAIEAVGVCPQIDEKPKRKPLFSSTPKMKECASFPTIGDASVINVASSIAIQQWNQNHSKSYSTSETSKADEYAGHKEEVCESSWCVPATPARSPLYYGFKQCSCSTIILEKINKILEVTDENRIALNLLKDILKRQNKRTD